MAALQKRVPVDLDVSTSQTKRQKISPSPDSIDDGEMTVVNMSDSEYQPRNCTKKAACIDLTADDDHPVTKTVTKSWSAESTPPYDEASDYATAAESVVSVVTTNHAETDVEYDEATKKQIKADKAEKITRFRNAMTSGPGFVFVVEYEEEAEDIWQPEPAQYGILSVNKTLDGALKEVADYFDLWGALQLLVQAYNKEQEKLGNVSFTGFIEQSEERATLLDLAYWSGDEKVGAASISMAAKDAETTYKITIKRLDLLA